MAPLVPNNLNLVLRSAVRLGTLLPALRREVAAFDSMQTLGDQRLMTEAIAGSLATRRFSMFVLGVFAAVALVLSCVGIFGVVSYLVNQRTQEIGVRMALGARPVDVLWLVLSEGGRLALVGIAVGTAAALALTGTISSLLFGVSPTDPMTFGSIAVLLLGTTLLACYVPARRAAHVDPMTALRAE